jgi:outer membrane immunogenic protein
MTKTAFVSAAAILLAMATVPVTAMAGADSRFYLGGGIGSGTLNAEVPEAGQGYKFDGNATAWKAFGGYNFGVVPLLDLGVEAGYVNLGEPSETLGLLDITAQIDGFSAFGLAGVNFGPVGLFAKAGMINWDGSVSVNGVSGSDSGTDAAYGVGAKLHFGSLQVRAEAEQFNIKDLNDVYMVSLSLVWTF